MKYSLLRFFWFAVLLLGASATLFAQATTSWTYFHANYDPNSSLFTGHIKVDPDGYTHVINTITSRPTLLAPDGQQLWCKPVDIDGSYGVDCGFDSDQNTYVLTKPPFSTEGSIRLSKLDFAGNILFNNLYSLFPNSPDLEMTPTNIAVALDGSSYVCGYFRINAQAAADAFVIAFDRNGAARWSKTWDGTAHLDDLTDYIRLLPNGNVIVALHANVNRSNSLSADVGFISYDNLGVFQWESLAVGAGSGDSAGPTSIDVASNGEAVLVTRGSPNSINLFLLRVDSSGNQLTKTNISSHTYTLVNGVCFDNSGHILVTGQATGGAFVQKLTLAGTELWFKLFMGPANYIGDEGTDVKVDASDNVFALVSGWFFSSPGNIAPEFFLIKYHPDGVLAWPDSGGSFYNGGLALVPNTAGNPTNLFIDSTGSIYAAGASNLNHFWDFFVGKVSEASVPSSITFAPNKVYGSGSSTATLWLSGPAPAGGLTFNLTGGPNATPVVNSLFIAAGNQSGTFGVNASNAGTTVIQAPITATHGSDSATRNLSVYPANLSQFVGQTVPSAMVAGQSYLVSLQFKNTSSLTWTTAAGYQLKSANPYDNLTFGVNRLPLTNGPVAPGATGTFSGTVIAPATNGTYNFQWRTFEQGAVVFGALSTNLAIPVAKAADAARYISKTGPTTVNAGADFTSTFTMMNVGTNTWTTAAYSLRAIFNNWGVQSIVLPSNTAPNTQKVFSRILTAPITPGTYQYQWQMFKTSFFGDKTPYMTVVVTLGADNAQFMSETAISNSIAPNASFGATFTMKNLGTATWGGTYSLVPIGSNNFGIASIVAGAVAQNNSGPFTATFTAPSTPGTYTFQMRMSHSGTKFGQATPLHTIVVSADAAQYLSRTGPNTVNAGADFFVQNTMKNTGSTSWTGAAGYYMMSHTPANNATWTINKMFLPGPGPFAPGTSVTLTGKCTAPITPATYTMQWQMSKSGVAFGEKSPLINIVVTAGPDNAQFVSQTGVPTTIVHGTTFNATITMRNIGSANWDGTYSLVSVGSNTFGIASIVATSTAPNANKAFTATFTAPATPGTYTFQMRMQHTSTKFGQPATLVTITVT